MESGHPGHLPGTGLQARRQAWSGSPRTATGVGAPRAVRLALALLHFPLGFLYSVIKEPPTGTSGVYFSSGFTADGFPCSSVGKESACHAGDLGSIPGLERSPGEGNGNPLQYSGLENPMDRGAWQATVHGIYGARVGQDLVTKPPLWEFR